MQESCNNEGSPIFILCFVRPSQWDWSFLFLQVPSLWKTVVDIGITQNIFHAKIRIRSNPPGVVLVPYTPSLFHNSGCFHFVDSGCVYTYFDPHSRHICNFFGQRKQTNQTNELLSQMVRSTPQTYTQGKEKSIGTNTTRILTDERRGTSQQWQPSPCSTDIGEHGRYTYVTHMKQRMPTSIH